MRALLPVLLFAVLSVASSDDAAAAAKVEASAAAKSDAAGNAEAAAKAAAEAQAAAKVAADAAKEAVKDEKGGNKEAAKEALAGAKDAAKAAIDEAVVAAAAAKDAAKAAVNGSKEDENAAKVAAEAASVAAKAAKSAAVASAHASGSAGDTCHPKLRHAIPVMRFTHNMEHPTKEELDKEREYWKSHHHDVHKAFLVMRQLRTGYIEHKALLHGANDTEHYFTTKDQVNRHGHWCHLFHGFRRVHIKRAVCKQTDACSGQTAEGKKYNVPTDFKQYVLFADCIENNKIEPTEIVIHIAQACKCEVVHCK